MKSPLHFDATPGRITTLGAYIFPTLEIWGAGVTSFYSARNFLDPMSDSPGIDPRGSRIAIKAAASLTQWLP